MSGRSAAAGEAAGREAAVRSALAGGGHLLGIGIDAVELARFTTVLARTPTFVDRVFTTGERAYAERRRDPTERYAARFAAKEATLKALGVGIGACGFREIEVWRDDEGAPSLVLHGSAATLAEARGVARFALTLTHTDVHAEALVVALGDPLEPASPASGVPASDVPARDVPASGAPASGAPATGVLRLRAHDPAASVAFYRDRLGFAPDPHPADGVARLVRDRVVVEVVGPSGAAVAAGGAAPVVELHLEVDDAAPIRAAAGRPAGDDGPFVLVDPDGVVVRVTERPR